MAVSGHAARYLMPEKLFLDIEMNSYLASGFFGFSLEGDGDRIETNGCCPLSLNLLFIPRLCWTLPRLKSHLHDIQSWCYHIHVSKGLTIAYGALNFFV